MTTSKSRQAKRSWTRNTY